MHSNAAQARIEKIEAPTHPIPDTDEVFRVQDSGREFHLRVRVRPVLPGTLPDGTEIPAWNVTPAFCECTGDVERDGVGTNMVGHKGIRMEWNPSITRFYYAYDGPRMRTAESLGFEVALSEAIDDLVKHQTRTRFMFDAVKHGAKV